MFCNSISLFLSDADEVEGFGVFCPAEEYLRRREELTKVMSLENKLRKPTQGQMPAAVVDELAVQPPQEPENVAAGI
jgi:hypothetical protein